jgi:heptosyltransferase I
MAAAVSTAVIGFYACINPDRARPYFNSRLVVNKYPEAIAEKHNLSIDELPWGTRVRDKGTMDKIKVLDATEKLDMFHNNKDRT